MTRRIVLALLAFTATVLVAAVVPLALKAAAHERDAFAQDAATAARSVAAIAAERLSGHAVNPALTAALLSAARQHDELLVLDSAGHVRDYQGVPRDAWKQLAVEATERGGPTTEMTKDRVIDERLPLMCGGLQRERNHRRDQHRGGKREQDKDDPAGHGSAARAAWLSAA